MRTPIYTWVNGAWVSHFCVEEFQSGSGVTCVNLRVVAALERLRTNLSTDESEEIQVIVTDGTRSDEDNERLATKYGWMDEGGKVSRNSQHLVRNGACGVDFFAQRKRRGYYGYSGKRRAIPVEQVRHAADQVFDFVKTYKDGHVHGDQRKGGTKV